MIGGSQVNYLSILLNSTKKRQRYTCHFGMSSHIMRNLIFGQHLQHLLVLFISEIVALHVRWLEFLLVFRSFSGNIQLSIVRSCSMSPKRSYLLLIIWISHQFPTSSLSMAFLSPKVTPAVLLLLPSTQVVTTS